MGGHGPEPQVGARNVQDLMVRLHPLPHPGEQAASPSTAQRGRRRKNHALRGAGYVANGRIQSRPPEACTASRALVAWANRFVASIGAAPAFRTASYPARNSGAPGLAARAARANRLASPTAPASSVAGATTASRLGPRWPIASERRPLVFGTRAKKSTALVGSRPLGTSGANATHASGALWWNACRVSSRARSASP